MWETDGQQGYWETVGSGDTQSSVWVPGVAPQGGANKVGTWETTGQGDTQTTNWVPGTAAEQQAANSAAIKGGASTAYDFGRYSNDVSKIPSLASDAFDNWQTNDYLSRAVNTAGYGGIYK